MKFRDLLELSVGNLWRTKIRAVLTTAGVVIAIATFVAMLSFGAGNQKMITDTYNELGLFTNMKVYPKSDTNDADTVKPVPLDKDAIAGLSAIPGVLAVYPYVSFKVTVAVADTQFNTEARALSQTAIKTKLYKALLGGHEFSSDSASEAILSFDFVHSLKLADPDTLIGQNLVMTTKAFSLDSAFLNIIDDKKSKIWDQLHDIEFDSLFNRDYRDRILRQEINEALRRFVQGLSNRQRTLVDTLKIVGIGEDVGNHQIRTSPVIIPEHLARKLSAGGYGYGNDLTDIIPAIQEGRLFIQGSIDETRHYPRVTLDLDPYTPYKSVKDSVEALGFRAFSFAEQFEQIQKFFIYFHLALATIGLIALVTASLGIANTLIMSIIERRREIGVIRSLGADISDIRVLFLAESAVIGAAGSVLGILFGWLATRLVAFVGRIILERQDMPFYDPFALPLWLILIAFVFGVLVSLLAGFYPASKAAKVDPVEALRAE